MKKKIIKIILIVLAIALLIFLINLGRKTYIISKYTDKCKEYANITNFYMKMNESIENKGAIVEFWRKDDLGIYKRTDNDGVRQIVYGKDNDWIIVDIVDAEGKQTKQAVKISKYTNALTMTTPGNTGMFVNNLWDAISIAFISRITTEKVDDIECYKIYVQKDWQLFINKDTLLKVRELNGNTDTGTVVYKFNEVTDEDLQIDFTGFEIIESNN